MMVRRLVVFPAPLRPRSIVNELALTERETPCRMWYCPMCVLTPRNSRSGLRRSGTRHSQVGFLHDRRGDDLRGLAVGDELALVQHDDAVGERAHHVHLV